MPVPVMSQLQPTTDDLPLFCEISQRVIPVSLFLAFIYPSLARYLVNRFLIRTHTTLVFFPLAVGTAKEEAESRGKNGSRSRPR